MCTFYFLFVFYLRTGADPVSERVFMSGILYCYTLCYFSASLLFSWHWALCVRNMKLTTHRDLVLRLRMNGAVRKGFLTREREHIECSRRNPFYWYRDLSVLETSGIW